MKQETNSFDNRNNPPVEPSDSTQALAALRRFARSRSSAERCELCGSELAGEHMHLLERTSRQITCSCNACAILFCGQQEARFLRIPHRILKIKNFRFTEVTWDAMMLPINLAFFLRQPHGETSVFYPSPAGVMESLIAVPKWTELFPEGSPLAAVECEVEALLINRIGDHEAYFVVPLDAAYRLVGLIRTSWRGLSGGPEVWKAIADFFAALEREATSIDEAVHA